MTILLPPIKKATETSLNATAGSTVGMTSDNKGKAQSESSITTPSSTFIIGGMSRSNKISF